MNTTTERWRFVAGTSGAYLVSDQGRLWSNVAGRMLRGSVSSWGYRRMTLARPVPTAVDLHALVMTTFVGPCPPGMEICHGGDDKTNNALSNLRFDTHRANVLESVSISGHAEAAKTECRNGHPFDDLNTYRYQEPQGGKTRQCRACNRDAVRRYKMRKKVAA